MIPMRNIILQIFETMFPI